MTKQTECVSVNGANRGVCNTTVNGKELDISFALLCVFAVKFFNCKGSCKGRKGQFLAVYGVHTGATPILNCPKILLKMEKLCKIVKMGIDIRLNAGYIGRVALGGLAYWSQTTKEN